MASLELGAWIASAIFAIATIVHILRPRQFGKGNCKHCGYSMDTLPTGICPECGHEGSVKPGGIWKQRHWKLLVLYLLLAATGTTIGAREWRARTPYGFSQNASDEALIKRSFGNRYSPSRADQLRQRYSDRTNPRRATTIPTGFTKEDWHQITQGILHDAEHAGSFAGNTHRMNNLEFWISRIGYRSKESRPILAERVIEFIEHPSAQTRRLALQIGIVSGLRTGFGLRAEMRAELGYGSIIPADELCLPLARQILREPDHALRDKLAEWFTAGLCACHWESLEFFLRTAPDEPWAGTIAERVIDHRRMACPDHVQAHFSWVESLLADASPGIQRYAPTLHTAYAFLRNGRFGADRVHLLANGETRDHRWWFVPLTHEEIESGMEPEFTGTINPNLSHSYCCPQ